MTIPSRARLATTASQRPFQDRGSPGAAGRGPSTAPRSGGQRVPSRPAVCQGVVDELALVVDETVSPSRTLLAHLDNCVTCRAELSRYRRLLCMLADLQSETELLPAGVLADFVGGLSRAAERRALRGLLLKRRGHWVIVGAVVLLTSFLAALLGLRRRRPGGRTRRPGESLSSGC
jgi:hypothetical protein